MNLAQLVVNCIKDTIHSDDQTVNVENLLNGNLAAMPEYGLQVNTALLSINRAISRLQTAKKIPLKSDVLTGNKDICIYDISSIKDIRKLISVYIMKDGKPYWIGFDWTSPTSIFLGYGLDTTIFIQYEKKIPNFIESDLNNTSVDLNDEYGLDDELCNYISYFAKSELYETIDPDRCKRYLNYFEQFVNEIDRRENIVYQNSVHAKHKW